jgi:hypothetical protein
MKRRNGCGAWPGMNFKSQTLGELRRRIRRERAPEASQPPDPPATTERPARRPERGPGEKGKHP